MGIMGVAVYKFFEKGEQHKLILIWQEAGGINLQQRLDVKDKGRMVISWGRFFFLKDDSALTSAT